MKYAKLPRGTYATLTQYAKAHKYTRQYAFYLKRDDKIKTYKVGEIYLVKTK